jgi:hypothetical protein
MMMQALLLAGMMAALLALGACAAGGSATPGEVRYLGIETQLLDGDLVSFRVAIQNAPGPEAVEAYGRCAAAQYALIRGAGFARQIRTSIERQAEVWRGDAVYLISAALPPGLRTIDAEVTVRDCGDLGIPTI